MKRITLCLLTVLCVASLCGCKAGMGTMIGTTLGGIAGGVASAAFPNASPVVQGLAPVAGLALGAGAGYLYDSSVAEEEEIKAKTLEQQKVQQQQAQAYAQNLRENTKLSVPVAIQVAGQPAYRVNNSSELADLLMRVQPGTDIVVLCNAKDKDRVMEDMKVNGLILKGAPGKKGAHVLLNFQKYGSMAPMTLDQAAKLL